MIIDLTLETENAIRHLHIEIQDVYGYLGAKGIKIMKSYLKINSNMWHKSRMFSQEY
jgi:hypothetical protein